MGNGSDVSIFIAFTAGVLTFISPCVLPLFPSYLTYITGRSFNDITDTAKSNIRKITLFHSLCFIAGFSLIFILLGISFSYLGSFFGINKVLLERIGGAVIIIFGLHLIGILKFSFLTRTKHVEYRKKKVSFFGSFLVGMAFAVGWTPCVGPILSTILIYAATIESMPKAVLLLFIYSIGLGLPFLICSIALNQFLYVFKRFNVLLRIVPVLTGVFLIIIGIILFLGKFSSIAQGFM